MILRSATVLTPALTPSIAAHAQSPLCFRGRPLPTCSAFTIFEITGAKQILGTQHLETFGTASPVSQKRVDLGDYLSWTLGVMSNRDSAHAIGGMVELGFDSTGSRMALKARQRMWVAKVYSLDFTTGGLVTQGHNGSMRPPAYGITADVALCTRDLLALTLGGDLTWPANGNRPRAALQGGVRLGNYAALAGIGLVVAGAALLVPRD